MRVEGLDCKAVGWLGRWAGARREAKAGQGGICGRRQGRAWAAYTLAKKGWSCGLRSTVGGEDRLTGGNNKPGGILKLILECLHPELEPLREGKFQGGRLRGRRRNRKTMMKKTRDGKLSAGAIPRVEGFTPHICDLAGPSPIGCAQTN